jgi:hypothetical protein
MLYKPVSGKFLLTNVAQFLHLGHLSDAKRVADQISLFQMELAFSATRLLSKSLLELHVSNEKVELSYPLHNVAG